MTDQEIQKALDFIKKVRPDYYERLSQMRSENPVRFSRVIRSIYEIMNEPPDIREAGLREKDAQIKALTVVRQLRTASDPSQLAQLRSQLRQAIAVKFQAEQEVRQLRLAHLEEQIRQLRQEMDDRLKQRDQIIAERVNGWLSRASRPARQDSPQGLPPG